jgi:hypothetical protein
VLLVQPCLLLLTATYRRDGWSSSSSWEWLALEPRPTSGATVKPPAWDSKTKAAALGFCVAVGAVVLRFLDGLVTIWLARHR